jgi:hypothetical protein
MIRRAGIALDRFTYDSEFSITQVDRNPRPTFSSSAHHKLVDGHSVEEIINIFHDTVGFDSRSENNGFVVSLPMSASCAQMNAFLAANHRRVCDHFAACIALYGSNVSVRRDFYILFIDLMPSQIGSWMGRADSWARWYTGIHRRVGEYTGPLNTGESFHELIKSIIPRETRLDLIAIFRHRGAFPHVSTTNLNSRLPDVPIKWMTLGDISQGLAILMARDSVVWPENRAVVRPPQTPLPMGIKLANGNVMTIVPKGEALPIERLLIFTTSKDDQHTATVQFCPGMPEAKVTLEGLAPRLRGQAAIKVTLYIDIYGITMLTMEEIRTGLKITADRETVARLYIPDAHSNGKSEGAEKQVEMVVGKDGIIGELPE